jgi:hypothetical protein
MVSTAVPSQGPVMNTFRTPAEITPDHRLVVALPPEMPTGTAEVVVTVTTANGKSAAPGTLRKQFGAVRGGDPNAADNDRVDAEHSHRDFE